MGERGEKGAGTVREGGGAIIGHEYVHLFEHVAKEGTLVEVSVAEPGVLLPALSSRLFPAAKQAHLQADSKVWCRESQTLP